MNNKTNRQGMLSETTPIDTGTNNTTSKSPVKGAQSSNIIAAVGAGRMGRGIAIAFALAGYTVRVIDIKKRSSSEFVSLRQSATDEIQSTMSMLSTIGLLDEKNVNASIDRVSYYAENDCANALSNANLIFEAVPETLSAKESALALISQFAQPTAIVASTTSTILSDQLQPFVTHPERFLNAHWLNPAFLIPLVEVSPGKQTDPAIVDRLNALLEKMGKVPVVCSASPGYIVPRIQALAMNEAARMVEEGVASVDDIDKATKYGFGFRFAILGLLEFIDWGGGDILYYASRYMTKAMDDERYASPAIIERNMKDGNIGLSTQKGFLDYASLNINDYQKERLSEFVGMLRHIGKLPSGAMQSLSTSNTTKSTYTSDIDIVKRYLNAIDNHDVIKAAQLVTSNFNITHPGGKQAASLHQFVQWSKTHYQTIDRTYERFDQCHEQHESVVYCFGTFNGIRLKGAPFSGVRFIDRFIVVEGKIESQHIWNELSDT